MEILRSMAKWDIKLSEFNIHFKLRILVKGKVLDNCLAEYTYRVSKADPICVDCTPMQTNTWNLFTDGSVTDSCSGVGIILVAQKRLGCAVCCKLSSRLRKLGRVWGVVSRAMPSARSFGLLTPGIMWLIANGQSSCVGILGKKGKMIAYVAKVQGIWDQIDSEMIT